MTTHRPYRSCCKFCVMRRGVNAPHRRSDAQDDVEGSAACVNGLWVSWREGIRGSCESCTGHPETETEDDMGNVGSEKKERSSPGSQREQRDSLINSGTTQSRSAVTTSQRLKHWQGKSDKLAKKEARLFQRDRQWEKASPMGSSNVL